MVDSQPTNCIENLSPPESEILNSCSSSNPYLDLYNSFQFNISNSFQETSLSDFNFGRDSKPEFSQTNLEHFFEGAEKLLEIWFTDNGSAPNATLRSINRCVPDFICFKS